MGSEFLFAIIFAIMWLCVMFLDARRKRKHILMLLRDLEKIETELEEYHTRAEAIIESLQKQVEDLSRKRG